MTNKRRSPKINLGGGKSPHPILYLVMIALIIAAFVSFADIPLQNVEIKEVGISQIQKQYENDSLESISIRGSVVTAKTKEGETLEAQIKRTDSLGDLGFDDSSKTAEVKIVDDTTSLLWADILRNLIPFLIIGFFILYMFRQAQGHANSAFSFGKSKAKKYESKKQDIDFNDVAGNEEVKEELVEIVDFLKHPKKYLNMGAKIPRGVLLMGPPGTGKTLLARAVAGEAKVPYFSISGSEFVEMFVGVGASRVRDLFSRAKEQAPSIIFIDEIDAVGRQRGAGLGGGNDEREQTLNQILSEMDGFEKDSSVIVIAATNRPDVLDPALLRPGRFDRQVVIDRPTLEEREAILKVHAKSKPLAKDVNLKTIASHTAGFVGADLENLLNESAIRAAKYNNKTVTQEDIEKSIEKVLMGPEKKARLLTDEEKQITAYHEVGHAIVGHLLPNTDPVHKVSIISRGRALGVTWFLPEKDTYLRSKAKFKDELASLLGGRIAEEIVYGAENITTGASNDLEKVTSIARSMVTEYGMSEKLGHLAYGDKHGSVFLGREIHDSRNYSDETALLIDQEVKSIVDDAYQVAKKLLIDNKKLLEEITEDLMKKEVIDKKEFLAYFK